MALAYKYIKNNGKFDIIEISTKQIVFRHQTQEDAKKHTKILNLGGGFDGFTPNFILEK